MPPRYAVAPEHWNPPRRTIFFLKGFAILEADKLTELGFPHSPLCGS